MRQALYVFLLSCSPYPSLYYRMVSLINQRRHMAADEMRTITTDKWTDDVWGVSTETQPLSQSTRQPRLFFYFGRNDHWVAEQTRDEIVAAREARDIKPGSGSGPRMIVCEDSVPHAFCLSMSFVLILGYALACPGADVNRA